MYYYSEENEQNIQENNEGFTDEANEFFTKLLSEIDFLSAGAANLANQPAIENKLKELRRTVQSLNQLAEKGAITNDAAELVFKNELTNFIEFLSGRLK